MPWFLSWILWVIFLSSAALTPSEVNIDESSRRLWIIADGLCLAISSLENRLKLIVGFISIFVVALLIPVFICGLLAHTYLFDSGA